MTRHPERISPCFALLLSGSHATLKGMPSRSRQLCILRWRSESLCGEGSPVGGFKPSWYWPSVSLRAPFRKLSLLRTFLNLTSPARKLEREVSMKLQWDTSRLRTASASFAKVYKKWYSLLFSAFLSLPSEGTPSMPEDQFRSPAYLSSLYIN